MQTHCDTCGTKLKPLWQSWFCPKCEGDEPSPALAAGGIVEEAPFMDWSKLSKTVDALVAPPKPQGGFSMQAIHGGLIEGSYLMQIDQCRLSINSKGERYAEVDLVVIQTFGNSIAGPGTIMRHYFFANNPGFLPEIKRFVAAVLNFPPTLITKDVVDEMFSARNPLAGCRVQVDVIRRTRTVNNVPEILFVPEWKVAP